MKNEHGLTPKQEAFVRALVEGVSQSDAYRAAYPASKTWKTSVVHVKASTMAADGKVQERLRALQAELADRAIFTAEEILTETRRIALSRPSGLVRRVKVNGRMRMQVLMPDELDDMTAAAVASFEIDDMGKVKYKFWDKNVALDRGAKIQGMYEKDNTQKGAQLLDLWKALTGKVVRPDPAAAGPDGEVEERDD